MLERVPAALRGRVVWVVPHPRGTAASTSPWIMGFWTDSFGTHASNPLAYVGPFVLLGASMWFSTLSLPLIAKLGQAQDGAIEPVTEITPRMMETVM